MCTATGWMRFWRAPPVETGSTITTMRGGIAFSQTNAVSGGLQEQYEYDAFGWLYFYTATGAPAKVNGKAGSPSGNRFLFTGREFLSGLRIYDFRNRMYQPELGRFLQPDPKQFEAGDYNLYRYCHNDPVNKTDPMGLEWDVWTAFKIAVGIQEAANEQEAQNAEAMRYGMQFTGAGRGINVPGIARVAPRLAGPVFKTATAATAAAKANGWTTVKGMTSMGQKVFTDGKLPGT
jgi:RHS repeat-associated protein